MSLIGKQIGNYQIKAKLGEGGMGAVYLGEHPLIGKRVAVKVLLEELASKEDIVTRFFNEAKAVNDIGHQNIVDIVDFGKMKSEVGVDIVYFIMEFLDGESLAARLRRTGLAFNETLHIIDQCCSALSASHAKGIVHRDLKPENLYLCSRGGDKSFVKILDFGIAKLTGDGGTSSSKTRTGLVIGTPTYMSPEQCEGKGLIDSRSDVYSLGVVMYELLTGRVPFPGEGFGEILVAHLTKEPEPPSKLNPDITPELEAIVLHAIEKDRNRRFQTMEEFGTAIADAASHFSVYKKLPGYSQAMASVSGGTAARAAVSGDSALGSAPTGVAGHGPRTDSAPRPTTLSGSAAQVDVPPPARGKTPMLVGVGAIAAGIVIAAVMVLGGGKKPTQPVTTNLPATTTPTPPPSTPQPKAVQLKVLSEPPGAEVVRAGKVLGTTPYVIDAKQGDAGFDIEVRKTGFDEQQRSVDTTESRELFFELKATPTVAAGTTPGVKKASSDHHHHTATAKSNGKADDMAILPFGGNR
jgi:serine/threonine-protein kinase